MFAGRSPLAAGTDVGRWSPGALAVVVEASWYIAVTVVLFRSCQRTAVVLFQLYYILLRRVGVYCVSSIIRTVVRRLFDPCGRPYTQTGRRLTFLDDIRRTT